MQVVLKDDMNQEVQRQWAERIVKAVNAVFPSVDLDTHAICQRLLPHTLVCATLIGDFNLDVPEAARLLNQTAFYLQERAQYPEALPLYQRALAIYEKVLGAEHPDTATSLNNLAMLYQSQGNYPEAIPLLQRALAIWEKVLGPEHPNTKTVQANYSSVRMRKKHG